MQHHLKIHKIKYLIFSDRSKIIIDQVSTKQDYYSSCFSVEVPLSYTRLMGRSLAYTPNISSSSESGVHTTVDTPEALYDKRERVRNIWASSHVLSRLLKSSTF